ncbi:MAG: PD40 domain-containing protein [Acidobacteria bacterium]|nr:PD40 domain-containing protein [Acidobacteriota bacterium]
MTALGRLLVAVLCLSGVAAPSVASAQYFGRNKVQYRTFDFQILRTDHFDIYYYPEEADAARIVARLAERWYDRLSRFFSHELRGRQPLILYAAAAHFRQTNAVEGLIGEGTGGVTEGLRRRVVLPMSGSLAESDHVLGHELVHAFQFDMTGADPRDMAGEAPGILAFPLWFVEGMAEYLSLGPADAQTAMWLRDAALREALPHIRDLDDPRYFPYRWGHAFWAYIGARFGDRAVASLIRSAANPRFDLTGLARQLGTDPDTLTADWHAAIRARTQAVADEMPPVASRLRRIIEVRQPGARYNVGPELSPDGRRVAFFSERDRFSIDLYLANADTGRIERRLLKTATDPHFDSLEFISSAGSWSPDGRTLALTAMRGGRPVLVLMDPRSGRITAELPLGGLDDASNPAFAPDGRSIVLSGNAGGLTDLYLMSLETRAIDRLTSDAFADVEPSFTPDGRTIVFTTERFTTDLDTLQLGSLRLAAIDVATRAVRPIAAFLTGKHVSPQVTRDGAHVLFVGDPDGISNVYRVPITGGPVEQWTAVPTGIAGITSTSPTLSVAPHTGRIAFSVFEHDGHALYLLDPDDVLVLVPPPANQVAAMLPGRSAPTGDVSRLLGDLARGRPPAAALTDGEPYEQRLKLDQIGQPVLQAAVYQGGWTSFQGGLSASFSDMLGDRLLGVGAQVGGAGSWADIGGGLVYVSRRHRWNWAASGGVSPYALGFLTRVDASSQITVEEVIERQTCRCAEAAASFPFSTSTRVEVAGALQALSFSREVRTSTYDPSTLQRVSTSVDRRPSGDPLYLGVGSVALVRDSSYFGATAPLYGMRSRVEWGRSTGSLRYSTLLMDWRRYFMPVRPITIAVRGLHYGRYGRDSDSDRLIRLYAGYPDFVHGYGVGSFRPNDCPSGGASGDCAVFDRLIGSRLAVANIEVRAPLKGLFTGELEYGAVPIDVAAFFDAGVAWTATDRPSFLGGSRGVVRSAGGAVRVNAFGLIALEVAASHPFDRFERGVRWQVSILQGF